MAVPDQFESVVSRNSIYSVFYRGIKPIPDCSQRA